MRRTAISLKQEPMSLQTFEQEAFFQVEERPAFTLHNGEYRLIPDRKVIVRKDDESYVSTVGKNYSIIDNKNYFDAIVNNLSEGGVDFQPLRVWEEGNGRRTTMILRLPQFKMYSGTTEEMDMELRIRNSFDTTLAADTILGFLRLICTNGMTSFEKDFSMRMTHKGDIKTKTEDAIELYKNFQGIYDSNKYRIERLGNTEGSKERVASYIGDGLLSSQPIFTGDRWASKIKDEWDGIGQPTNLWSLYNMFTEIISHRYGSNFSSKVNMMDKLNKEVLKWDRLVDKKEVVYG